MRFAEGFLRAQRFETQFAVARDGNRRGTLHHAGSRTQRERIRGSRAAFRRAADKAVHQKRRADGIGRNQKYPCKKESSFLIPARSSPQFSGTATRGVAWSRRHIGNFCLQAALKFSTNIAKQHRKLNKKLGWPLTRSRCWTGSKPLCEESSQSFLHRD